MAIGWGEDAQRFFIGLELDNSRSYFDAHRRTYEQAVKAPMEELMQALEPEFGAWKIFRINRDVRFSKDKSPYKTNIAAVVGAPPQEGYVSYSARGLGVGAGRHLIDGPGVAAMRLAVAGAQSGAELQEVVERLRAAGYEVGGEELKTVPPGFPRDHPRGALLRLKSLTLWRDFGLQPWLGTPEVKDRVAEVLRDSLPLQRWLAEHVPPPVETRRR